MLQIHYASFILVVFINNFSNKFILSEPTMSSLDSCPAGDEYCSKDTKQKCKLTPQSNEGPFFLPNQPIREDIREGRVGVPLQIEFIVKTTNCKPVQDAHIHLWHADALGVYSAYSGYYPLGDPNAKQITGPHAEPTEDATFLRGIQITDSMGRAKFHTIYPGWYRYRTLHLHFKITFKGSDKYTGEIYFPDELTDEIAKVQPYKEHNDKRLKNKQDSQFLHDNGQYLVMRPKGNVVEGLKGQMEIIISSNQNTHNMEL